MLSKTNSNNTILGFDSKSDFLNTIFCFKQKAIVGGLSAIGGLSSFITGYIYSSAEAIYFMVFLLSIDLLTAVYRAAKTKTFTSRRLPRVLLVALSYCLLLAIGYNAAKFNPSFDFLPGMLYFGFISVLIISIMENLVQVGLLPKSLFNKVKIKIDEEEPKPNDFTPLYPPKGIEISEPEKD